MNFLNNAIAQVSDLFRSMTPGARITAGLLLTVVVVSFGYLFRQGAAGPDTYLFGAEAISDGDLTRMEFAIGQAGLSGHVREGNRLRVPAGQRHLYMGAIADAGAQPANFNTILESALGKTSPFDTRETARERINDARQRQLSEIIRAMSWVEEAVVILDEEEVRGLSKQKLVTASVSVQPKVGQFLDAGRADKLKTLLASAVTGLTRDSVAVTDLGEGGGYASAGGGMDPAMFDNPYYKDKVMYEQLKRESILRILSPLIPGALVEVNAELDDTASETTVTTTPDKASQVTVRSTQTDESSKQSTGDGGGRPGAVANSADAPQNNVAQSQRQNQSETTKSVTEEDSKVGEERKQVTRQGFTPKEVQASVAIPTSHFVKVWATRNPAATTAPTPEDLKIIETEVIAQVENLVEPLIRKTADEGQNPYDRVKVVPLATLPVTPIEPPSMSNKAIAWTTRYWNTFAMLGVAMFSLMVLRSVVKAAPPAAAPIGGSAAPALAVTSESPAAHADHPSDAPSDDRPRLKLKKGVSIKDDLLDIVREDPDAAADILRSWIGKAG